MSKLKTQIAQLRKLHPKHSRYGQLYSRIGETRGSFNRVTLYTLFVSDDGDWLLRPHVFHKNDVKTPRGWHEWFAEHLSEVMQEGVLPGLSRRTGLEKQWAVWRVIGWVPDAQFVSKHTGARARRNQTEKEGG